ncbi:MAG TPA: YtxH domain-containing protein [Ktedonobacterales bacterium]|jgi:gas vesicle protein
MRRIRAFIWGGAIGALVGLLFAPQTGEETRAQIQSRFTQWQGQAQSQMNTLRARSSNLVEQGAGAATSAFQRAQSATSQAAERAQDTIGRTGTMNS